MCRSIKKLRRPEQPATDTEVQEAALQFVRKISGYRTPSRANQQAFDQAVADVAASTRKLLDVLGTSRTPSRAVAESTREEQIISNQRYA